jgi:HEAT repeat protein
MSKGSAQLIVLVGTLSLVCGSCEAVVMDQKEAQEVLREFYVDTVPEPFIDRHLLAAGKAIVPQLLIEIQKRDMPRRGYAILALGKIGDTVALPTLVGILQNASESDTIRSDALRAIWRLDQKLGSTLAKKHLGESAHIDRVIRLLEERKL